VVARRSVVAVAFNDLLARLEDAMSRQRQLVARASHSLRTPAATILTRAEVALRREREPAAYREALEEIATAARESAVLIRHLLTLSRLDERRGCDLDEGDVLPASRSRSGTAAPASRPRSGTGSSIASTGEAPGRRPASPGAGSGSPS
jgi:signal transduction histidine kinase